MTPKGLCQQFFTANKSFIMLTNELNDTNSIFCAKYTQSILIHIPFLRHCIAFNATETVSQDTPPPTFHTIQAARILSADCLVIASSYFLFSFRYCRIPICMAHATRCWYSGVQSFSASALLDRKPHSTMTMGTAVFFRR